MVSDDEKRTATLTTNSSKKRKTTTTGNNSNDDLDGFIAADDESIRSYSSAKPKKKRKKKKYDSDSDQDRPYINNSDDDTSEEQAEEDDDFIVPENETSDFTFDYSLEKAKRWSLAVNLPKGVWSEGERQLFSRLAMRGFEPLIPKHWHFDFPTLPDSLFTSGGEEADMDNIKEPPPVIHAIRSDFHCEFHVNFFSFSMNRYDLRYI